MDVAVRLVLRRQNEQLVVDQEFVFRSFTSVCRWDVDQFVPGLFNLSERERCCCSSRRALKISAGGTAVTMNLLSNFVSS